jgi:hypothetical protein
MSQVLEWSRVEATPANVVRQRHHRLSSVTQVNAGTDLVLGVAVV